MGFIYRWLYYLIDTEGNIFKAKASEHENMPLLEAMIPWSFPARVQKY